MRSSRSSYLALLWLVGCGAPSCESPTQYTLKGWLLDVAPTQGGAVGGGAIPSAGGQVEARLFLGVSGSYGLGIPTPVEGATVTLHWTAPSGAPVSVTLAQQPDPAPGFREYVARSSEVALEWVDGARYTFEVRHDGRTFLAHVDAPPRASLRLTGPLVEGVHTTDRPVLEPAALERDCTDACPEAFVQVLPGSVSFAGATTLELGEIPTCSTFPPGAYALGWLDGATGARVPLPGTSCFDRVVQDASRDELFFVRLIAITRGAGVPHADLAEALVVAGVADGVTVRVPAPPQ